MENSETQTNPDDNRADYDDALCMEFGNQTNLMAYDYEELENDDDPIPNLIDNPSEILNALSPSQKIILLIVLVEPNWDIDTVENLSNVVVEPKVDPSPISDIPLPSNNVNNIEQNDSNPDHVPPDHNEDDDEECSLISEQCSTAEDDLRGILR